MPKESVLDPQGVAVQDAIHHQGMDALRETRVGKVIYLDIDPEKVGTVASHGEDLQTTLHRLCRDLLSNPVVEDYLLEEMPSQER